MFSSVFRWIADILILLTLFGVAIAQDSATPKNVLILFADTIRSPDYASLVESAIRARTRAPVNFYVEYLETARFDDEDYET